MVANSPIREARRAHRLIHVYSAGIGWPFALEVAHCVDYGPECLARATIRDEAVDDICRLEAVGEEGQKFDRRQVRRVSERDILGGHVGADADPHAFRG